MIGFVAPLEGVYRFSSPMVNKVGTRTESKCERDGLRADQAYGRAITIDLPPPSPAAVDVRRPRQG
jgi:hypothetical protein